MSENPSTSDLLADLDAMYEAANRRAEAEKWRDHYATGYSDGIWDARTRVREAVALEGVYKAYEKERALCTSVLDQYRHLEGEMNGLIHMTNEIRDLADASAESEDSADWVCGLLEIIRLLDGDDA